MTSSASPIRTFTGAALSQIAFPLGGIGTGTVSLGGRGNLQDWEIFNRPGKGSTLFKTFCALRVAPKGGKAVSRVLEREYLPPFSSALGFRNHQLAGLPRFREATFRGEYPFAWIDFEDAAVPAAVSLEAYNPFIPMDVESSSIPGLILNFRIRNTSAVPVSMSLLATMLNPAGAPRRELAGLAWGIEDERIAEFVRRGVCENVHRKADGAEGVFFAPKDIPATDARHGTAALTTPWPHVKVATAIPRGGWWDGLERLWRGFADRGDFPETHGAIECRWEPGALCLSADLAPGEVVVLPVHIHWHFANAMMWGGDKAVHARTYVSKQFADAWDAVRTTNANLARLERGTREWHRTFFASSLPPEVLDAASSQLCILRSPTVMRLADGNIFAWEGCNDMEGSCAGNCTHVWNYEQALAQLFPELERTMRGIEFGPSLREDGAMTFRCEAPIGAGNTFFDKTPPCVDGQMGGVMQAYRDWQLSGDDAWLRSLWPNIRRALEYAWTAPNGWDPNKDGVIEGVQHNTYDIEFYGPNTMLGSVYLGALRAAEEMARHLGDDAKAREYRAIYDSGRARTERELWNGEHFIQTVDVAPGVTVPKHLITPGTEAAPFPKYQYGLGCLSDQLLGQWEAHCYGLGHILDSEKVRTALAAVYRNNFRTSLRDVDSVERVFAFQDEAGLLLCTWPGGGRPALPFVYCDEVWTGIEYQVAAHLIYEGMVQEGLDIVSAVRARYDGIRRNPWDEIECGHHYARALASWSLIQALSGARYSAVEQSLTLDPRLPQPFRSVVALGTGWGEIIIENGTATLVIRHGTVTLRRFGIAAAPQDFAPRTLRAGDRIATR